MRCLQKNKVKFYYALYKSKSEVKDEYGNSIIGEYEVKYEKPQIAYANISAAQGKVNTRQFGESLDYNKTIALNDTAINEYSILWIDTMPTIKADGTTDTPHDYVVTAIAKSLNGVSIAVKKVNVSA